MDSADELVEEHFKLAGQTERAKLDDGADVASLTTVQAVLDRLTTAPSKAAVKVLAFYTLGRLCDSDEAARSPWLRQQRPFKALVTCVRSLVSDLAQPKQPFLGTSAFSLFAAQCIMVASRLGLLSGLHGVGAICELGEALRVEVQVFSGTENPRLELTAEQSANLCKELQSAPETVRTCRVLGFTGWRICDNSGCVTSRGQAAVDELLLQAGAESLPVAVLSHVKEEATRLLSANDDCQEPVAPSVNADCSGPVVGPDDPSQVHYDVENDDGGCFVTEQSSNNCYDYGNDIVTNTFAQPGRGSGLCPETARPCVKNTCEDVKNAAVSDGLQWVGTDLPTSLPETGHYVSLHIWPDSNFHWLRMDANMKWSHKPGGSPVRNVDNNQQEITDPSKADVSPWSEHCGYLLTVPSKVSPTIKTLETMV